jgi:regulator of nucleoside diphosphate kinase
MEDKTIYITKFDIERLEKLLDEPRRVHDLDKLEEEMDRCEIVDSRKISPHVVTLNSRVRLCDLDLNKEMIVTLVFPKSANLSEGRLSVASPVGTAILGYAVGDVIEWDVRAGTKKIRIEEILYQPEAAGDYHL